MLGSLRVRQDLPNYTQLMPGRCGYPVLRSLREPRGWPNGGRTNMKGHETVGISACI